METYERIRHNGKTIYLGDPKEIIFLGRKCLRGSEVDKSGELTTTRKGVFTNHIIELSEITKRTEVFENGKYGTLENEPWKP